MVVQRRGKRTKVGNLLENESSQLLLDVRRWCLFSALIKLIDILPEMLEYTDEVIMMIISRYVLEVVIFDQQYKYR